MQHEINFDDFHKLLETNAADDLAALLVTLDPADIAELLDDLSDEERVIAFALLPEEVKPDVLSDLEHPHAERLIAALPEESIADILEEMAPDDLADVLSDLDDEKREQLLRAMEPEERQVVSGLLTFEEDTAGHVMTPEIVTLPTGATVGETREALVATEFSDPILFVFAVDDSGKLVGMVSLERLFTGQPSTVIGDIIETDFHFCRPDEDQEEVAHLFEKYDTWVIPVLDADDRPIGRITVDDIIDVVRDEADEDLALMIGAPDFDDDEDDSAMSVAGKRLPWLIITLFAGLINSVIVKQMLDVTNEEAILLFVAAILAMGGNTGIQSSTICVRGLALGHSRYHRVRALIGREVLVGLYLGVVCGLVTAVAIWAGITVTAADIGTIGAKRLAVAVGLSMCNAMVFGSSFGALAPIVLKRFGVDPAVAAGPLITTINDISASFIYFGTCVLILMTM
jgi:magnesium transporter